MNLREKWREYKKQDSKSFIKIVFLVYLMCMIALCVFFYQNMWAPKRVALQSIEEQIRIFERQNSLETAKISEIKKLDDNYNLLREQVNTVTSKYYPELIQKKITIELFSLSNKSDIYISSVSFSEAALEEIAFVRDKEAQDEVNQLDIMVEELDRYREGQTDTTKDLLENINSSESKQEETQNNNEVGIVINTMEIDVSFEGKYESFTAFLKELEILDRAIMINNVSLSEHGEYYGWVDGDIELSYFSLPKLEMDKTERDKHYEMWEYDYPSGRTNPFR